MKGIPGTSAGAGKSGAGGTSIASLFKDKRVMIGAAVAGGLGLVVLLKKGNGDTTATDTTSQPQSYSSEGFDTYNAISQLGEGWAQQLQGIQDALDNLGQQAPVGGGSTTNPGKPITSLPVPVITPREPTPTQPGTPITTQPVKKPTPRAAPKKTSTAASYINATKFTTASAARGSNWKSTLSTIAAHYHTSVGNLLKLNPSIHNANNIHAGQQIRVK